jgi:hypothetical protein
MSNRAVRPVTPGLDMRTLTGMWHIRMKRREPNVEAAELAVQLEDLLHQVWECERWWRLQDRLDLAARITVARREE